MLKKIALLLLVSFALAWTNEAGAQTSDSGLVREQLLTGQNRSDANAGTVTIMTTRNLGSSYMQMALDLSTLLDSGEYFEQMRVIPLVARGKVQNLWDILYLKGIDIGFVQSDSLEYLQGNPKLGSIKRNVRYICVMPPEEVHIIARKDIRSIWDLAGKTVSINAKGTGSSVVGTLLFRRLGIPATLIHEDTRRAVARMKSGEIAAHFNVLGKPARPVVRIKSEGKLHLLPIPYSEEVRELYIPSKFTSEDYPELVAPGKEVVTIAARNVLAVYNWEKGSERYRKVERFVDAFFSRFSELQEKGFHPKWRDINLAAAAPGWERFGPAQEWLDNKGKRLASTDARSDLRQPRAAAAAPREQFDELFRAFLQERSPDYQPNEAELKALYETFLKWRSSQQ